MVQDAKGSTEKVLERFAREYAAGTVLFHEGDAGEVMYVIRSGLVRIVKRLRGRDTTLGVLEPGDFFGEMAILGNRPRTASAIIEEDAVLITIGSKAFESMLRSNTEIAVRMIRRLADRLAAADRRMQTLLLSDPHSRVAAYFLQRMDEEGVEAGSVRVTVDELSAETGCAPVEVREALRQLQELGLVEPLGSGGFEIQGRDALAGHLELLA